MKTLFHGIQGENISSQYKFKTNYYFMLVLRIQIQINKDDF